MNKNGTIRNPPNAKPEASSHEQAQEEDLLGTSLGSNPLEGRKEKRAPITMPLCLVTAEDLLLAEKVVTVNVSPRGARVVTKRHWQAEERPWLASLSSEFRVRARVIYCQPLADGHFCVGLGFQPGSVTFGDQTWW